MAYFYPGRKANVDFFRMFKSLNSQAVIMMKKTILSAVIVFLSLVVTAQTGFRPGYVIKNNGDTLNGLVNYTTDGAFGRSCKFKRFDIAREVVYRPGAIRAYGFRHGRHFESKTRNGRLVFLECLVRGEISVYVVPGKYTSPIFIDSPLTGFFELKKGTNHISGRESFAGYAETLEYLLGGQGGDFIAAKQVDFDARQIARLISTTDMAADRRPKVYVRTPGVRWLKDYSISKSRSTQIGITGGYQFLTVNIPGDNNVKYFQEAEYNNSFRPVIGLYLNQRIFRRTPVLSVDLSALYMQDTYYGYSEYENSVYTFSNDIFFDFTAIQVPLALVFRTGKGRVHPFFKAGIFMSFMLSSSYYRLEERLDEGNIFTNQYADYTTGTERGWLVAAGVEWEIGTARIVTVEAGYLQGMNNLYHTNTFLNSTLNTECISFQIRFNL